MQDSNDPLTRRMRARVGHTLRGKWKLDSLLGVGGMACVYAATHRNGMRGAVKVLHVELSNDESTRTRFLREGYLANQVGHPGVVTVLDDDTTEDGAVFLVMELLEGETLSGAAASIPDRRMPLPRVLEIGDQLLDVLAAAHEKGIVHRDIKPDNLFWTQSGRLKVLDFGIARMRDVPGAGDATKTGNVLGTPAFMPPEQALGESRRVNALSDLWAVGATLFTLASGRRVREAESTNKMLLAAMTQPAPPLASVLPDVVPAFAALVDRALAFEQADRFPDARSMQEGVRGIAAGLARRFAAPSMPQIPAAAELTVTTLVARPASTQAAPAAPPPSALATGIRQDAQPTASPLSRDVTVPRAPARRMGLAIGLATTLLLGVAAIAIFVIGRRDTALPAPASEPASAIATGPAPPVSAAPSASEPVTMAPTASPMITAPATSTASAPRPSATGPRPAIKRPAGSNKRDPLDKF